MRPRHSSLLRFTGYTLLGTLTSIAVSCLVAARGMPVPDWDPAAPNALLAPDGRTAWIMIAPVSGLGWTILHTERGAVLESSAHSATVYMAGQHTPRGCGLVHRTTNSRHLPLQQDSHRTEFQFGWPFRCMWAASDHSLLATLPGHSDVATIVLRDPPPGLNTTFYILPPFAGPRAIALPLGILPFGMIADAILFGASWMLLRQCSRMFRCHLRTRKGLCPHCAYDVRATPASSPCPECGHMP